MSRSIVFSHKDSTNAPKTRRVENEIAERRRKMKQLKLKQQNNEHKRTILNVLLYKDGRRILQ